MTRRHAKEYRPDEALSLVSADRAGESLCCPSCGSSKVRRTPPRAAPAAGRVQLVCAGCGRVVRYIDRDSSPPATAH